LAALLHPSPNWSLHLAVSKGYSPPSIAEVRPAAGGFDTGLQAEYGWNYEAGLHLSFLHNRIQGDLTAFRFDLQQAIVPRTVASGAQYFINAGGTRQSGLEAFIEAWPVLRPDATGLGSVKLWTAVTLSDFSFRDYKSGNNDYSGHALTGVPHDVVVSGLDLGFLRRFSLSATYTYTSRIYLTDANDAAAPSFNLWQFRAGWKGRIGHLPLEVHGGVDNAGNVLYSLGHDLNAFGKRYYNPAPGRNYYVGTVLRF
jgi:iron complex outermembrane recepter protein